MKDNNRNNFLIRLVVFFILLFCLFDYIFISKENVYADEMIYNSCVGLSGLSCNHYYYSNTNSTTFTTSNAGTFVPIFTTSSLKKGYYIFNVKFENYYNGGLFISRIEFGNIRSACELNYSNNVTEGDQSYYIGSVKCYLNQDITNDTTISLYLYSINGTLFEISHTYTYIPITDNSAELSNINDSVNDVNDSINSEASPSSSESNDLIDNNSYMSDEQKEIVDSLINLPNTFYDTIVDNVTCSSVSLGTWFGTKIVLPCISLEDWLGEEVVSIIDILITGCIALRFFNRLYDLIYSIFELSTRANYNLSLDIEL